MLFEGANIARKIALTILEPQRARSHCCPCPCRRAPASINRRCCSACAHPMRTASPSPASLVGSPRPPAASAPPPSSLLARAPDVSLGRRSGRGGGGGGTCQRGSCLLQVLSLHISDHALLLQRFLHGRPHSASPTTRSERWADGCNQSRAGRREPVRKARGRGAHVHIRELLRQSLRVLLLRLQLRLPRMETFAIAGGGGVPCGLGWRTSVPRSFVSSADCACSILSTSTISCFTLRVATCHRQQLVGVSRRASARSEP